MNAARTIAGGVVAAVLLASGGVVAAALTDVPQEATPVPNPTVDLNTQPTPPAEPEPEAAPAPVAPIAITPVGPLVPAAEEPVVEEVEDKQDAPVVEKAEVKEVVPVGPMRRQRRRVAIIEAVDKITAVSMRFEVEVGGRPVRFQKSLIFSAKACEVSAPDEQVGDAIAYMEVSLQPRGVLRSSEPRKIFGGWMFASTPAINGLEHPIYDAWVVGCKA